MVMLFHFLESLHYYYLVIYIVCVKQSALLRKARYINASPSAAVLSITHFVRLSHVNKECPFLFTYIYCLWNFFIECCIYKIYLYCYKLRFIIFCYNFHCHSLRYSNRFRVHFSVCFIINIPVYVCHSLMVTNI